MMLEILVLVVLSGGSVLLRTRIALIRLVVFVIIIKDKYEEDKEEN